MQTAELETLQHSVADSAELGDLSPKKPHKVSQPGPSRRCQPPQDYQQGHLRSKSASVLARYLLGQSQHTVQALQIRLAEAEKLSAFAIIEAVDRAIQSHNTWD